jgi:hypothetical protein
MELHVGIAMDVKKTQQLLWNLYAGIAMVIKKPITIMRFICKYCIYEMALWKL